MNWSVKTHHPIGYCLLPRLWRSRFSAVRLFSSIVLFCVFPAFAMPTASIDELLKRINDDLTVDLNKTRGHFEQLVPQHSKLSRSQQETYSLLRAAYLRLTNRHREKISLLHNAQPLASNDAVRVKYLHELSSAYFHLAEYEDALKAIYQGINLTPKLSDIDATASMLQVAVVLLVSLGALEHALDYANRLYRLGIGVNNALYTCTGLTNKVEIQFMLGEGTQARAALSQTLKICDNNQFNAMSGRVRKASAIHMIDSGQQAQGVQQALVILAKFLSVNPQSAEVSQLEEAIARGYHQLGKIQSADKYAGQAYQHAIDNPSPQSLGNASKTLAEIKRAQGELALALNHYDIYLREKTLAEADQQVKNLAYQRVKYDNLEKFNQLTFLKFKNNSLALNQKLRQRSNKNLMLVLSVSLVLLIFMSILLVLSLKKKQSFFFEQTGRAQNDGFVGGITTAEQAFMASRNKGTCFCVMLFELDYLAGFEMLPEDDANLQLLSEVSKICNAQLRKTDQFGRINEHQFVICLLQATDAGAIALAQRCQEAIAGIQIEGSQIESPITSIFGVAIIGQHCVDYHQAMGGAQRALQLAKALGGEQIYVHYEDAQEQ
jgi:diguanylate cyclase (GGDEF)-like protein